ncbi:MAG: hypothetical protein NVS4B12_19480 [Ktedonobacteraceae bacterium]
MTTEELTQLGNLIEQKIAPLKQGQAQIKTVVEALAAGQQDIREQMVTKADLQDIDAKLVKKVQSHERRINTVEDELNIPHPHNN